MTISQEHFSKVSTRKCDVRLDLVSFLKVAIICRHATLNFARTLALPPFWVLVPTVIWKIKKILNHLIATVDTWGLKKIWRKPRHTLDARSYAGRGCAITCTSETKWHHFFSLALPLASALILISQYRHFDYCYYYLVLKKRQKTKSCRSFCFLMICSSYN